MAYTENRHEELPSTWLLRGAERYAQRPALITESGEIGYRVLHDRAARLARDMANQGMTRGAPLAVIARRADRVAWALYLALYSGCPVWPLDPRRPDLASGLHDAGIALALVDSELSAPDGIRCLSSDLLDVTPAGQPVEARPVSSSDIQLIVNTSGSTGTPRAVMLTAGNLAAAVLASRKRVDLRAGDVWLACLPLYHVAGISILLRCLQAGASVLLQERFEVDRVWSSLLARKVTHLSLVPPMLEGLMAAEPGRSPPPSLKVVLLGGGAIPEPLVRRAVDDGWPVCPTYGLSENASQVATLCTPSRDWVAGDMGAPLDGIRVEIIDEAGRSTEGQGRIRISGPTVMAGYLGSRWSTGDGLVNSGFSSADLGYLDERGHLHVQGRLDDVIVSGAENVMPQQIEDIIRGCKGITDVGVVGVPDSSWGQRVVALFEGCITEAELEHWCRKQIPSPLRPRGFVKVETLPRNAMGKLDRQALRRRAIDEPGR